MPRNYYQNTSGSNPSFGAQGPQQPADPMDALATLLSGGGQGDGTAYYAPGVGAIPEIPVATTRAELDTPYERGSRARADAADARDEKQVQDNLALADFFSPDRTAQRNELLDEKLAPDVIKGRTAENVARIGAQSRVDAANAAAGAKLAAAQAPKPTKFTQEEQRVIGSAQGINELGQPLLQKFRERFPGIEGDPNKYSSATDMLTSKFGKGWYSLGGMTDRDDLIQESEAIRAWGMRALASGRINQQMMNLIDAHLPNAGFSAGANYDRLNRLLTTILPAQLRGIDASHGQAPTQLQGGSDPYANPDYVPR